MALGWEEMSEMRGKKAMSADTEALKALVAAIKEANAHITVIEVNGIDRPTYQAHYENALVAAARAAESAVERMLASQTQPKTFGQDMVLVPRETLGKALTRLEYVANKIPENVPMTFHEEDCYYLATEIKTLLAKVAAPVASQMGEPFGWLRANGHFERGAELISKHPQDAGGAIPLYAAPAAGMDAELVAGRICQYLIDQLGHDTDNTDRAEIAAIIRRMVK